MVYKRKDLLVVGQVYHVFSKSIARFRIFKNVADSLRMLTIIRYYQMKKPRMKFSGFIRSKVGKGSSAENITVSDSEKLVEIIAYCIMPTHLHLILMPLKEKGISIYMGTILNSYARYFNTKHNRKGPLWEGRFKSVLVKTDEQLLHLTRYIHLNPVTAKLVDDPADWSASSYREYVSRVDDRKEICKYGSVLSIEPGSYRTFVLDGVSYQRELAKIKAVTFD